jgi:hypothetical protein
MAFGDGFEGQPLSRQALQRERSLESYLAAAIIPRFMTRLREIHDELVIQRLALQDAYRQLGPVCEGDLALFERRWRHLATRWDFGYLNELIDQHNEYYPIEANLPIDPRTGDYVTFTGASHRRERLGADWILERFPPSPAKLPGT